MAVARHYSYTRLLSSNAASHCVQALVYVGLWFWFSTGTWKCAWRALQWPRACAVSCNKSLAITYLATGVGPG